jgi:hypothetical protein
MATTFDLPNVDSSFASKSWDEKSIVRDLHKISALPSDDKG